MSVVYLMFAIIANSPNLYCPFGTVCSTQYGIGPATATINLSLTLTSAQAISMNSETLDKDLGAYRLVINTISTGTPDARTDYAKFLILDNTPQDTGIQVAMIDGKLTYSRDEDSDAIVMEATEENERMVYSIIEEMKLYKELIANKNYKLSYTSLLP